jgi:Tfp pilus assembly protein PilO
MTARYANRLWILAGVVAAAMLALLTWAFAVSPQQSDTTALEEQTLAAHDQANELRTRIVRLKKDKANLPALKRELATKQDALPANSGVPAFLRQLQATGTKVGADISGIAVGDPAPVETTPGVWSLPIQLTAEGTPAQLNGFLTQLQDRGQERAILIETANLKTDGSADGTSLSLAVKAFVAPPVGTTAVTTD